MQLYNFHSTKNIVQVQEVERENAMTLIATHAKKMQKIIGVK